MSRSIRMFAGSVLALAIPDDDETDAQRSETARHYSPRPQRPIYRPHGHGHR